VSWITRPATAAPERRNIRIDGSVAVVTGASRGLGRAIAIEFGRRGATVALVARTKATLDEALAMTRAHAPESIAITADVTDRAGVFSMVQQVIDRFERVDVLVNNAGGGVYGPFLEVAPSQLVAMMDLNFWGTVHAIEAILPGMLRSGGGHIVNIGAVDGRIPIAGDTSAASKCAVMGLTEALAAELRPHGVHVTLVNPGSIDTESFRRDFRAAPSLAHRIALRPERVARAVVRAVERDRVEVSVPRLLGVAIRFRYLAPGLFRRIVARAIPDPARHGSLD
jgi:short-subunit dehydrogenase